MRCTPPSVAVSGACLGPLTSPEAGKSRVGGLPLLLVPLGATEQHGPHLPLSTDTLVAAALCDEVASRADPVAARLVAPAMPYGASGEHAGFAGTLSIGTEILAEVLLELARSAEAVAGLVVVSGHGGNAEGLASAADRAAAEGRRMVTWLPAVAGADAHAGRSETSLLLFLAPHLVRLELAEAGPVEPLAELWPALRSGGVRAVSPNGVLGDPSAASAAEGATVFAQLADDLDRVVAVAARCWNGITT